MGDLRFVLMDPDFGSEIWGSGNCVEQWAELRRRHPSSGERVDDDRNREIWDSKAHDFDGTRYIPMMEPAVSELLSAGILDKDTTVLDIGSGPGIFAKLMSPHVASITCTDVSPAMIDRLNSLALPNVTGEVCGCFQLKEDHIRDVSFASLCPPMNCPEGLMLMERMCRKHCVYISPLSNDEGIESDIWKRLGKDYTYRGSDAYYPYGYLRSIGRDPRMYVISFDQEHSMSKEDAEMAYMKRVTAYVPNTDDVRDAVRSAVKSHYRDSVADATERRRFSMIVWEPPQESL